MDPATESKMNSEGGEGRPGEHESDSHQTNSHSRGNIKILTSQISSWPKWMTAFICCFLPLLVPPTSLPLQGGPSQRKKLSAPRISLSLDQSEDDLGETPDDLDINVDDLDTPDEGDYLDYTDHETDWEGELLRMQPKSIRPLLPSSVLRSPPPAPAPRSPDSSWSCRRRDVLKCW